MRKAQKRKKEDKRKREPSIRALKVRNPAYKLSAAKQEGIHTYLTHFLL